MPERKAGSRAIGDDAVRRGTGKGWAEWMALLDGWSTPGAGATQRARHLREAHGVSPWWSHAVVSRWEWERGIRREDEDAEAVPSSGRRRGETEPAGT